MLQIGGAKGVRPLDLYHEDRYAGFLQYMTIYSPCIGYVG